MKTISDIKENVELLHTMDRHARMETEKKYKAKIFAYYEQVPELKQLVHDLENHENGEYSIDDCGELIYSIEVSKEIKELPEIGDWLTGHFGTYKDGNFSQWCGPFISIQYEYATSYFVFDHDCGEPIIDKRPSIEGHPRITEDDYIRAKIELYMRSNGTFNDVIVTNYYGGYDKHFDMKLSTNEDINLDARTDEELQLIIDEYENKEDI